MIKQQMAQPEEQRAPGMVEEQRAPAEEQQPAEGQADSQESSDFTEEPTPEEQQAYEKVVLAAGDVLYDPKTNPKILQMLQSQADDPASAIANATVLIMTQLDDKSGGTIPEIVILPAAAEVAVLVAELAKEKGIFEVDDATLTKAGHMMLVQMAEQYGVDPADLEALVAEVSEEEAQQMYQQQNVYGSQ